MSRNQSNELIEWAKERGWIFSKRKTNHLCFRHPKAANLVFVSSTFSDHRGPINAKNDMKRALKNSQAACN